MPTAALDHPHLRLSTACPFCRGPKAQGSLACWPCYASNGLRDGSSWAETVLDRANTARAFDTFARKPR